MHTRNQSQHFFMAAGLTKRVLTGAALAFVLICTFLLSVDHPDPSWPDYWYLRPLFVLPLAGATGGACYHFLQQIAGTRPWKKATFAVLGLLVYVFGLWMGTVLGLNGTLWH